MNTIVKSLGAFLGSATLLTSSFVPVIAEAYSISIEGNGADSENTVRLESNHEVQVQQENSSEIDNHVQIHSNTGNNHASENTGGDVSIETGDADVEVSLTNEVEGSAIEFGSSNSNSNGVVSVSIQGNGADSENDVDVELNHEVSIEQTNTTHINNNLETRSNTGGNSASRNTGGDVSISTGNSSTSVQIHHSVGGNRISF